jgi:sigma54-dependent transcription regulator
VTDTVNRFYNSIENAANESQSNLVGLFLYFLTVEVGQETATAKQICDCFVACDLAAPAGIAARLSEGLKTKPKKYLKNAGGYKLERHMREALSRKLGAEQITVQTSATLRGLEHKLPDGVSKGFLKETIDCFEAGATRATVTMAWILAVDHLFAHISKHKSAEFNTALAADKGVKLNAITQRDDFTEIKEGKFIELCRAAKIISNDVRKIMDASLGTRNSCAHPSGITVSNTKVISIVEDLVENVVLKYPV